MFFYQIGFYFFFNFVLDRKMGCVLLGSGKEIFVNKRVGFKGVSLVTRINGFDVVLIINGCQKDICFFNEIDRKEI